MPQYVKKFEAKLAIRNKPSVENMRKDDYIYFWFEFFEKNFAEDISNSEESIRKFSRYDILKLQKAFDMSEFIFFSYLLIYIQIPEIIFRVWISPYDVIFQKIGWKWPFV